MKYIEISTVDNDKYYIEGHTQVETEQLFWELVTELNVKAFVAIKVQASNSLCAIRGTDIKQLLVIGEEDLPLTRKPNFIELLTGDIADD